MRRRRRAKAERTELARRARLEEGRPEREALARGRLADGDGRRGRRACDGVARVRRRRERRPARGRRLERVPKRQQAGLRRRAGADGDGRRRGRWPPPAAVTGRCGARRVVERQRRRQRRPTRGTGRGRPGQGGRERAVSTGAGLPARGQWARAAGEAHLLADQVSSPERFELSARPAALPRLLGGRSPFHDPPLLRLGSRSTDRRLPRRSDRLTKERVGGDEAEPSDEDVEWIRRCCCDGVRRIDTGRLLWGWAKERGSVLMRACRPGKGRMAGGGSAARGGGGRARGVPGRCCCCYERALGPSARRDSRRPAGGISGVAVGARATAGLEGWVGGGGVAGNGAGSKDFRRVGGSSAGWVRAVLRCCCCLGRRAAGAVAWMLLPAWRRSRPRLRHRSAARPLRRPRAPSPRPPRAAAQALLRASTKKRRRARASCPALRLLGSRPTRARRSLRVRPTRSTAGREGLAPSRPSARACSWTSRLPLACATSAEDGRRSLDAALSPSRLRARTHALVPDRTHGLVDRHPRRCHPRGGKASRPPAPANVDAHRPSVSRSSSSTPATATTPGSRTPAIAVTGRRSALS